MFRNALCDLLRLNSRQSNPFAPAEDRATLSKRPERRLKPCERQSGGLQPRTVRLATAGAGTKAINPSVLYPTGLHSRLACTATIIIHHLRNKEIIVANHS